MFLGGNIIVNYPFSEKQHIYYYIFIQCHLKAGKVCYIFHIHKIVGISKDFSSQISTFSVLKRGIIRAYFFEIYVILDKLFCQISTFIKFCVTFVFGLQTLSLIDFTKIYQLKGAPGAQKQRTHKHLWKLWFYEKVYLILHSISPDSSWQVLVLILQKYLPDGTLPRTPPFYSILGNGDSFHFKKQQVTIPSKWHFRKRLKVGGHQQLVALHQLLFWWQKRRNLDLTWLWSIIWTTDHLPYYFVENTFSFGRYTVFFSYY